MKYEVIIIGTGQAAIATAMTLRQNKFEGSILMIGNEDHLPYQRPPLSKAFLKDEITEDRLYLKSASYFSKNKIEILSGTNVEEINLRDRSVSIANNNFIYQKLVLCTGSSLKKIKDISNERKIHYLRTIEDAKKIKSEINGSNKILILGGGYIGLEIASVAALKGLQVTLIETEDRLMRRSVCKKTASFIQKKHEEKGVNFLFNTTIDNIEDYEGSKRIIYENKAIDFDSVIIGVGIKPNENLAKSAGLSCQNGIIVNEFGQTIDQNVYSAGDCTNHPSKVYNKRLRLESVQNAVDQGKIVASSILGIKKEYAQVPWFWSEQYDLKIQIAGLSHEYDDCIIQEDSHYGRFLAYYLLNNKLVAADAINSQKEFLKAKKLISSKSTINRDILIG